MAKRIKKNSEQAKHSVSKTQKPKTPKKAKSSKTGAGRRVESLEKLKVAEKPATRRSSASFKKASTVAKPEEMETVLGTSVGGSSLMSRATAQATASSGSAPSGPLTPQAPCRSSDRDNESEGESGGGEWRLFGSAQSVCNECGCDDADEGDDEGTVVICNKSSNPISYANGGVYIEEDDLSSRGFGQPWGHTRTYGNQVTDNAQGVNGNSWFIKQAPYLKFESGGTIVVVGAINDALWFDYVGGVYVGRFGIRQTLTSDSANHQFVLMDEQGQKTLFHYHGESEVSGLDGKFKGTINRAGYDTTTTYDDQDRLQSLVMTDDEDIGGYYYEYYDDTSEHVGLLRTVTYRINGTDVRRSSYQYYGSDEASGNLNDLKTATIEQPGAAAGEWVQLKTHYYRYYKAGESYGFQYGLKYLVGPEAYARMVNASLVPETASDEQVAAYADNYFQYDEQKRATMERTRGGAYEYSYEYETSSLPDDYNQWRTRATETLPDDSQNIVYSNHAGQMILKIFLSGGSTWCTYFQYGTYEYDSGYVVLEAESSAIASCNDPNLDEDLVVTLREDSGLIHLYEYYDHDADPEDPDGAAKGYLHVEKVRQGATGTPITLREKLYTQQTVDDSTIYPVWKSIVYQSDASGGSNPAVTEFAYQWYYGSFQVYQRTTTLPLMPTNQNGSGVSATRREIMDDCCGRVIWAKNERGFIMRSVYDRATGAIVRRVQDVDTTLYDDVPTAWTTPEGGGLNLVNDYEFDLMGRTTQELGPMHEVDLKGKATTVRRARWNVHRDEINEQWEGTGYAVVKALRRVLKPIQQDYALQFDGVQNQVVVPYNAAFFPQSALTVECWVKSTTRVPNTMIGGTRDVNSRGYSIFLFSDVRNTCFSFSNDDYEPIAYNSKDVCDGKWHHIAGVWTGSRLVCYVDGVADKSISCNHLSSQTNRFIIGDTGAGGVPFNGTVDELRVSKVARYLSDFTPETSFEVDPNTIAYYKFNEGIGSVLHSATGYQYNGALEGEPLPTWVTGVNPTVGSSDSYLVPDGYDFTLINPVSITKSDKQERVTDTIQAVRQNRCGKLSVLDEFPQSSWVRWVKTNYDNQGRLTFRRVYFDIPECDEGLRGINYNQTDYSYDVVGRRNGVRTPGGTITRAVFHPRGWRLEIWVGTDDTGATDSDPSGSSAVGNNMVKVQVNVYDEGVAGGDGNLTVRTLYEKATATRATTYGYDFRNRRIRTEGELDVYEEKDYDNLNRVTNVDRWDNADKDHLIASRETLYDSLNRIYRTIRYGMNPSSSQQPPTKTPLTDNIWYDAAGNVIKQAKAGSLAFQKMVYDGVGRMAKRYTAYDLDESSYADAGNVDGDTVMEQIELTYDEAGNQTAQVSRNRFHNATGEGELTNPNGAEPKARVSYTAFWPDPVGRQIAFANYGTNGAEAWTRPATVPECSDLVLVKSMEYNDRGEMGTAVDSNGIVTKQEFDDAGRQIATIENFCSDGLRPSDCGAETVRDINRTKVFTYNADGKQLTLTVRNSVTGDQVTRFVYGTTLKDSGVASNRLLRAKIYPDSDDGNTPLSDGNDGVYDRVEYCYNRLGEMTESKDQAGTVHAYDYDKLGRLIHDRVTLPVGSTVDNAVLRISREYEVRGMLAKITSYNNATVGTGAVVNQVLLTYNAFGQLKQDYQAHSGEVNTETTPVVAYDYANGSANTIRPVWIKYPDGRQLDYDYSGTDDALSRISGIKEHTSGATLAGYTRLGLGPVVNVNYPEPDVDLTFIKQTNESDGDAGDQYTGLDRFGRIEDIWWTRGETTTLERIQHGYDPVGNKRWRQNLVATSGQDEFYDYDKLYQLMELQRGNLNDNRTAISGIPAKQEHFTYDPTGNWRNYLTKITGAVTLDQGRTHNKANETWQIDDSNATVASDPVGNMVKMPDVGGWSGVWKLTWDAWNRLVKSERGPTMIAIYAYDGFFRRTVRTFSSKDQHFYYSRQWQVLEVLGSLAGSHRQFVWGLLGIDNLVLRDQFQAAVPRLYAIQDTMHVIAVIDNTGTVRERYGYDAFGNTRIMNEDFSDRSLSNYDWETRFCGYHWDSYTGLYQVRYRYLHSGLGRWLSRDSIEDERVGIIATGIVLKGIMNLYGYVQDNPITGVDLLGLEGDNDCTDVYDEHGSEDETHSEDASYDSPPGLDITPSSLGANTVSGVSVDPNTGQMDLSQDKEAIEEALEAMKTGFHALEVGAALAVGPLAPEVGLEILLHMGLISLAEAIATAPPASSTQPVVYPGSMGDPFGAIQLGGY